MLPKGSFSHGRSRSALGKHQSKAEIRRSMDPGRRIKEKKLDAALVLSLGGRAALGKLSFTWKDY